MNVASFTRNRLEGVKTTEWDIAPFNLRYGVTPRCEVGIFVVPHLQVTERFRGGAKTTWRGVGDTTLRSKFNFWGNDGGAHALGLMVDLKLPTAANGLGNDKVEGAVTLPVAYEIGAGWEGAAMTSLQMVNTGTARPLWRKTSVIFRNISKRGYSVCSLSFTG